MFLEVWLLTDMTCPYICKFKESLSYCVLFSACSLTAPKTFNLDIALVKLERPVKLNDMVNVACLPEEDEFVPSGTYCITAGWGHTMEGKIHTFEHIIVLIYRGV